MIRYEPGRGGLVAIARVRVGSRDVSLAVPLGPWDGSEPPAAGLAGRPVVIVPDRSLVGTVAAGARRSGAVEPDLLDGGVGLGARLLRSTGEVMVVTTDEGAALTAVRGLGGRPLPVLAFPDDLAVERSLAGCEVDLDIAIPSTDPARGRAREVLLRLGLEDVHHVVEVDPRPAFAIAARDPDAASLVELTAAAAGVLAGRVAAGNRRWR